LNRDRHKRPRLPSHGTAIAYLALFLALAGSGYAARSLVSTVAATGPTVVTQEPAYTINPHNSPNFLTAITAPSPNPYLEEQYTVAEDDGAATNARSSVYMPLLSPSEIAGSARHLSSVQFCINISANSNTNYHGQSSASLAKATVYEFNEPSPGGGPGSGNANGPPAYSHPVALLQKTFSGQTQIDNCPTVSSSHPLAINRNGYLVLFVTVGLTTTGDDGGYFGTHYVQLGRVTTTYAP
jgi:hypothetical protein